jgi:hypothetical protein
MTDQKRTAVDRQVADIIPFQATGGGTGLARSDLGQAMEFAKLVAAGQVGVPAHLQKDPVACLRIVTQASRSGLDPFYLADESSMINGKLTYSAKAIYAMVLQSGKVEGRLHVAFAGEGEGLSCTVTGMLKGDSQPHTKTTHLRNITTRNSPLWKTDPQQQLAYFTQRAWCRLYAPDAIASLASPEDVQEFEGMKDVTPEEPKGEEDVVAEALGLASEPEPVEVVEETEEEETPPEAPEGVTVSVTPEPELLPPEPDAVIDIGPEGVVDEQAWCKEFCQRLKAAKTVEELDSVFDEEDLNWLSDENYKKCHAFHGKCRDKLEA